MRLLSVCCLLTLAITNQVLADELTPADREQLVQEAKNLEAQIKVLYGRGEIPGTAEKMQQLLLIKQRLFSPTAHPDGHEEVAVLLYNLGQMRLMIGDLRQALPLTEQAVAMYRKLYTSKKYPDGHAQLANSLNNLGSVLEAMGEFAKALPCFEECLRLEPEQNAYCEASME